MHVLPEIDFKILLLTIIAYFGPSAHQYHYFFLPTPRTKMMNTCMLNMQFRYQRYGYYLGSK